MVGRVATDVSIGDVFDDSAEARRREEVRAYIGPHAEAFMPVWASMQARAAPRQPGEKRPRLRFGFIAMAFFLGPCWFFYRKLWLWAWGLVGLFVVLALLPLTSRVGLPLGIFLAMFGRQAYLGHVKARIAKLRGGAEFADLEVLRRAGGVSPLAGWISSVVIAGIALLGLASLILLAATNGGRLPPGV